MAALKLVVNNTVPHTRPYQTMYYTSGTAKMEHWSRSGRAASPVGALRAAVVRLITGQYYKAIIHGESGEIMYTLIRKGRRIEIIGLFMNWNE